MTEALVAFLFLAAMEIVLGIDNIVFITILTGKLPESERPRARQLGLMLALGSRLVLLSLLFVIQKAVEPIFFLSDLGIDISWLASGGHHLSEADAVREIDGISVRDLILLIGGLFLVGKATIEIHDKVNHVEHGKKNAKAVSFSQVLVQIAILDIVFSLDSVITAVGMAKQLWVMVAAVVVSMAVMLAFSGVVSRFVEQNPTIKMLALSFLILIGVMLLTEGAGAHVEKGYIYFAMTFSLVVEFLNLRVRALQQRAEGKHS
ncbi:MAG TPA: hypothetical protein DCQ98_08775 [Planctomycetaceae bacterium]|nr:hypothetical protein [Planctomycetaceae bacterium]HRE99129.1 TerC family protein [Pirellulaceae bacterium]